MDNFAATALLVLAIVLPVALFWLLKSRSRLHGLLAAAIAVAIGWGLNVAWAFASQVGAAGGDTLSIAIRYGWACPVVLVFVTWLVWRFRQRRRG